MKRTSPPASQLHGFPSGASLGGKLVQYHPKQSIYSEGMPAPTLFYIQQGGVWLTVQSKKQPAAVTTILGPNELFGELCLVGYPRRVSSAVALTNSSILTIPKETMLQMLRDDSKTSNELVAHLLSKMKHYQDHVADLLTCSAEKRLALVLLRLAHLDTSGPPLVEIPILSHQVLAEMIGTTRSRVNFFMNRFRKQKFIDYDDGLEINQSLRKVLRKR